MINTTDDRTLCCSRTCEKRFECAKADINNEGIHYVEDYSSFGTGTYTDNGCEIKHWCGKQGNYKMFEPIEKGVATLTLENIATYSNETDIDKQISDAYEKVLSTALVSSKTFEEELDEQRKVFLAEGYLEGLGIKVKTDMYGYYRHAYDILRDLGEYLSKRGKL